MSVIVIASAMCASSSELNIAVAQGAARDLLWAGPEAISLIVAANKILGAPRRARAPRATTKLRAPVDQGSTRAKCTDGVGVPRTVRVAWRAPANLPARRRR